MREAVLAAAKAQGAELPVLRQPAVPVEIVEAEIIPQVVREPEVRVRGQDCPLDPTVTERARLSWSAVGRGLIGILLASTGIAIAVTSIRANNWFGRSLSTDPTAQEIFSNLSVLAEVAACVIPTACRFYWQDGDWRTAMRGYLLMAVALVVVFFASSGFVLSTISSGVELRADVVTPAVTLAERTADTLSKSRQDECHKRGERCRALEAREQKALADLSTARAEVRAQADPQAEALHIDSNTVRTIQAAAMVGMSLMAGYLIAFGARLIFREYEPR